MTSITCAACKSENPVRFKFCGNCGKPLAGTTAARQEITPPDQHALGVDDQNADRRQLTVLFCDLVGSTAIGERLDPEDFEDLIRGYSATCAGIIEGFGGLVAEYLGDGILAHFGYPRAHEDDAERAVRAALDIVEALGRPDALARPHAGNDLAVRIGIATGIVVTGDLVRGGTIEKKLVIGQTVNLAARLQNVAERNTILISASTRKLLGESFECAPLGPLELKGFADPVPVWRVIKPSHVEGRFQAMHSASLLPMVDREDALGVLTQRWGEARSGSGRVVLLSGEPGIGKSRIVQALRERIASEDHAEEYYQCASYYSGSALHPIIEQLESRAGIEYADAPEQRLAKLARFLARWTNRVDDAMPLFAVLLSIPVGDRYPAAAEMSPQKRKQAIFAGLVQYLVDLAYERPVLLVFEDTHWIDPSSLELLGLVVERAAGLRLLMVCTDRPGFSLPCPPFEHVTRVSVERLQPEHSLTMLHHISRGRALPESLLQPILTKTDGIPLFLEELTRTLLDVGFDPADGTPSLPIPPTLQDSLRARLDQLGPAKRVAQIGSAIGREFSHELLAQVTSAPEAELNHALEQLLAAGLIRRRDAPSSPQPITYVFKHALVQDAAYDSLLRRQRRAIHARIGDAIEQHFPRTAETNPEILAQHYSVAGIGSKAADYWLKAGKRASERSANVEAIEHLGKGLDLVGTLPESPDRKQLELSLLLTLGATLINTRGPGHPQVQATYARVRGLCASLPDSPQQFPAYWGMWRACFDLKAAREIADKLLSTAQAQDGSTLRLQAHHAQWATLFNLGELTECCRQIDAGLALYDPAEHASHATVYGGHDPKVCGYGEAALALWLLGFPDRARQRAEDALAWARSLNHPASLAHAYDYALMLYQYRREADTVLAGSEIFIAFATDKKLPHYRARGTVLRGWACAALGDTATGIGLMGDGLDAQRDTGIEDDFPMFLDMLAEACLMTRQLERCHDTVDEALMLAERSGMRAWWAELIRRKGELLLAQSDVNQAQAEKCYLEALELAQRQRARSLQLRAGVSLARLRRHQGEREAARESLAAILADFTEGWQTADLVEARALLDALRQ